MSKTKPTVPAIKPLPEPASKTVAIPQKKDETWEQTMARALLLPTINAASTIQSFNPSTKPDLTAMVSALGDQVARVKGGNLGRAESMLTAQAHTLDTLFNTLAQRAAMNLGQYLDASERYLRLALKAQGQCRATLETLAAIKNPPVVYARQANISHGPQQINNGMPGAERVAEKSFESSTRPGAPAQAEKTPNPSNELLETAHGERLDT